METKDDRTLFFDLLPLGFRAPSGLLIKLRPASIGQVAHDGTRKAVLSRADGIVFVADSDRTQETNNGEAFQSMADNCHRVGLDFGPHPPRRPVQQARPARRGARGRDPRALGGRAVAAALRGGPHRRRRRGHLRIPAAGALRRHDAELGLARDHGVSGGRLVAGILGRP